MKKSLIVLGLVLMCGTTIGCTSTSEPTEEKEPVVIEEQIEQPEEEIVEVGDDLAALDSYIYASLTDEQYAEYFEKISFEEIEFDATVTGVSNYKEYDSRFTLMLYPGDFDGTTVTGPTVKIENVDAREAFDVDTKVRVKGTVVKYDTNNCYLKIISADIIER